jgi:DNA-binding Xre family transcriptional regulator
MSPYALAKATGLSLATVYRLTNNQSQRVELETIDKLCGALKCQPGDLFVRTRR